MEPTAIREVVHTQEYMNWSLLRQFSENECFLASKEAQKQTSKFTL